LSHDILKVLALFPIGDVGHGKVFSNWN